MPRRKSPPIEPVENPQAEVRVVRSRRTIFMCPMRPREPHYRIGRLLDKAAEVLRRVGMFGARAA
ncbi:MAG: hypothetical protein ACE14L_03270 [Terriglobales bacterium]